MTPQSEFMNLLCDTVDSNCDLGTKVSLKELPPKGGIYAELGESFTASEYYDRTAIWMVPVLLLCKGAGQETCLEMLSTICNYLQSLKEYPQGSAVSWIGAKIEKGPGRIGKDEEGFYYYSCIINCSIYF